KESVSYQVLTAEKLLNVDDFLPETHTDIDKSEKIKEIIKMQNLSNYIVKNYRVSLEEAEKIVYTTFKEANKKDLEPLLVLSIISVESTFKKNAKSHAGAVGLTQVMAKIHRKRISDH